MRSLKNILQQKTVLPMLTDPKIFSNYFNNYIVFSVERLYNTK